MATTFLDKERNTTITICDEFQDDFVMDGGEESAAFTGFEEYEEAVNDDDLTQLDEDHLDGGIQNLEEVFSFTLKEKKNSILVKRPRAFEARIDNTSKVSAYLYAKTRNSRPRPIRTGRWVRVYVPRGDYLRVYKSTATRIASGRIQIEYK